VSRSFSTPAEVEAAFYDAIERADIKALDDVWSHNKNIVCVHPGAPRLEGRSAVMQSFAELLTDAPALDFTIVDSVFTGTDALAIHLVREEIALDGQLVSVMIATNIYQLESSGWRMLLHHASPEPDPVLMADDDSYQAQYVDELMDEFDEDLDDWEPPQQPPVLH